MVSELSIIAFSDWRVQSFKRLEHLLEKIEKPDLIIYAGDDTNRFIEYDANESDLHFYEIHKEIAKIDNLVKSISEYFKIALDIISDKELVKFEKNICMKVDKKDEEYDDILNIIPNSNIMGISIGKHEGRFHSNIWHSGKIEIDYNFSLGKIVHYIPLDDPPFNVNEIIKSERILFYAYGLNLELRDFLQNLDLLGQVMRDKIAKKIYLGEEYLFHREYLEFLEMKSIEDILPYLKQLLSKYTRIIPSVKQNFLVVPNIHRNNSINKLKKFHKKNKQINVINWFEIFAQYAKNGICVVLGNDCYPSEKELIFGKNVHYIGDENFKIRDWEIIGIDGTEEGEHAIGATVVTSKLIMDKISKITKNSIIVSHSPPRSILDVAKRFGINNVGSKTLREEIDKNKQIRLVICGHVHAQGGNHQKNGHYTVVNASSHDSYGSKGNVASIKLNDEVEVTWYDTTPDLAKIDGISYRIVRRFEEKGIYTREELENLPTSEIMKIGKLKERKALNMLNKLRIASKKGGEWNGVLKIPPVEKTIFLDIETDTDSKRIWMIGVLLDGEIKQFVAKNWNEERRLLGEFKDYLTLHPALPIVFYSATHFDFRVIRNAAKRLRLKTLQKVMKKRAWIDIALLLKKVYSTGYSMGLKKMCEYFEYPLTHKTFDGFRIALLYESQVNNGVVDDNYLLLAQEYNLDDIKSIPYILEKLKELFPRNIEIKDEYLYQEGALEKAIDKSAYIRKKENVNEIKQNITIGCLKEDFDDVYYGFLTSGIPLPAVTVNIHTIKLTWKGKSGFPPLLEVLQEFGYKFK